MPETLEDLVMMQPPTAERPLLGSMILVVEDSRHISHIDQADRVNAEVVAFLLEQDASVPA